MRMERRGPDVATLLVRALRAQAVAAGITLAVRSVASRPWASATYAGSRHRIAIAAIPGDALDGWIAALPERDWQVRGHLVADLVVDSSARDGETATVLLAILTIEDD